MKKKKLQLHRSTIAHLTAHGLARVLGGEGPGEAAGIQSVRVDTRMEPCQKCPFSGELGGAGG